MQNSVSPPLGTASLSQITQRAALMSVGVAFVLIVLKGWALLQSHSVAMLASLADSSLDFAASLLTYMAVRYAASPPDFEHRYGHGKAEAFAGLFQAGLVAVSAALVAIEAGRRVTDPQPVLAGREALLVMGASLALTAWLVAAQARAIKKTNSVATKGDQMHYAADFAATIVAGLGIAAAHFLKWEWADPLAGLGVAAWLAYGAYEVAREAANHLMDREAPAEDRARIKVLAQGDSAVFSVHDMRTRISGPIMHIQFHADLDPNLTLKQAHEIVVEAEKRIRAEYPSADIIIHPDPRGAAQPHGHEFFAEGRDIDAEADGGKA